MQGNGNAATRHRPMARTCFEALTRAASRPAPFGSYTSPALWTIRTFRPKCCSATWTQATIGRPFRRITLTGASVGWRRTSGLALGRGSATSDAVLACGQPGGPGSVPP